MERRSTPRNPEIRAAEVVFGDTALRCVAYSLSLTGARVHLLSPSVIPETVTLRLPNGIDRLARRVWQRAEEVGFEYLLGCRGPGDVKPVLKAEEPSAA